jgi:hypothetical protein
VGKLFVTWCKFVSPQSVTLNAEAVQATGLRLPVLRRLLGVQPHLDRVTDGRIRPEPLTYGDREL